MRKRSSDEELEEAAEEELSGRKERKARRKLRRKQRRQRKGLRSKQKLNKHRRRAKASRPVRSKGNGGGRSPRRSGRTPAAMPRHRQMPQQDESLQTLPTEPETWNDEESDWEEEADWEDEGEWEDEGDDWEDDFDDLEEEYLEGTYTELGRAIEVGRLSRGDARAIFRRVQDRIRTKREKIRDNVAQRRTRRAPTPTTPTPPSGDGWGPVAMLNRNLRIQAGNGHRAAVMSLRPGLYLVADVKEQAVLPTTEGGVGAVLPLLMAKGAANALRNVVQNTRERRQGRRRLWDRERNNPVLNPPSQPHLAPSSPPLLLAGPVAGNIGECCEWTRSEDW